MKEILKAQLNLINDMRNIFEGRLISQRQKIRDSESMLELQRENLETIHHNISWLELNKKRLELELEKTEKEESQ